MQLRPRALCSTLTGVETSLGRHVLTSPAEMHTVLHLEGEGEVSGNQPVNLPWSLKAGSSRWWQTLSTCVLVQWLYFQGEERFPSSCAPGAQVPRYPTPGSPALSSRHATRPPLGLIATPSRIDLTPQPGSSLLQDTPGPSQSFAASLLTHRAYHLLTREHSCLERPEGAEERGQDRAPGQAYSAATV